MLIGFSVVDLFGSLFSTVANVTNYITDLLSFIAAISTAVLSLGVSFFVGLPGFINMGLISVFGLGLTILIVKLVK